MARIKVIGVGQTKESWLEKALQEYEKRLKSKLPLEWTWIRNDALLIRAVEKERQVLCLDPKGLELDSEEFAALVQTKLEEGGASLTFVIGGPAGLPLQLKEKYPLISLSKLTLTHQCIRLILAEQIYRATEIWRGSPYHK